MLGGGPVQQVGVAVVHDPVLRAGQPRRQPAAHRTGTAAQVVHDQRPVAGQPAADQRRPGRSARAARVGRLAQPQPVREVGRESASVMPPSPPSVRPPGGVEVTAQSVRVSRRSPGGRGAAGPAATGVGRASGAARRPARPGRRAAPAGRAGCRRGRARAPRAGRRRRCASTGTPRASASVTTMPYVSPRDGSTSRSAAAYAASSAGPVRRADQPDPVVEADGGRAAGAAGRRSRGPGSARRRRRSARAGRRPRPGPRRARRGPCAG